MKSTKKRKNLKRVDLRLYNWNLLLCCCPMGKVFEEDGITTCLKRLTSENEKGPPPRSSFKYFFKCCI